MLVEISLLTGLPPADQLTSAKPLDSLGKVDRQTRVAVLDWSSAVDGGRTVRTGGGRLQPATEEDVKIKCVFRNQCVRYYTERNIHFSFSAIIVHVGTKIKLFIISLITLQCDF